jgi:hypothetical protein
LGCTFGPFEKGSMNTILLIFVNENSIKIPKFKFKTQFWKEKIVGVRVHTWGHNPGHSSTFELKNNIIKQTTHQYSKCIKTLLIVA